MFKQQLNYFKEYVLSILYFQGHKFIILYYSILIFLIIFYCLNDYFVVYACGDPFVKFLTCYRTGYYKHCLIDHNISNIKNFIPAYNETFANSKGVWGPNFYFTPPPKVSGVDHFEYAQFLNFIEWTKHQDKIFVVKAETKDIPFIMCFDLPDKKDISVLLNNRPLTMPCTPDFFVFELSDDQGGSVIFRLRETVQTKMFNNDKPVHYENQIINIDKRVDQICESYKYGTDALQLGFPTKDGFVRTYDFIKTYDDNLFKNKISGSLKSIYSIDYSPVFTSMNDASIDHERLMSLLKVYEAKHSFLPFRKFVIHELFKLYRFKYYSGLLEDPYFIEDYIKFEEYLLKNPAFIKRRELIDEYLLLHKKDPTISNLSIKDFIIPTDIKEDAAQNLHFSKSKLQHVSFVYHDRNKIFTSELNKRLQIKYKE